MYHAANLCGNLVLVRASVTASEARGPSRTQPWQLRALFTAGPSSRRSLFFAGLALGRRRRPRIRCDTRAVARAVARAAARAVRTVKRAVGTVGGHGLLLSLGTVGAPHPVGTDGVCSVRACSLAARRLRLCRVCLVTAGAFAVGAMGLLA